MLRRRAQLGQGRGSSQALRLGRQRGRERTTGRWGLTLHPEKPCRPVAGCVPLVFEKAPAVAFQRESRTRWGVGKQGH